MDDFSLMIAVDGKARCIHLAYVVCHWVIVKLQFFLLMSALICLKENWSIMDTGIRSC